jgi:hypothetical protein
MCQDAGRKDRFLREADLGRIRGMTFKSSHPQTDVLTPRHG